MTAAFWNRFSKPMMGLALVAMILGVGFGVHAALFFRGANKAEATIVEMIQRSGDQGTMYAPVFVFADSEGRTQKVFSSVSSFPPIGSVGDKITVLYDPQNPKGAAEDTFFRIWGLSAILGGCGTFYLALFWLVWFITKQKMTTANQRRQATV